ncbi:MAG: YihY/virulence factor BrkB family protein [Ichthyobacteriaceae bacterium]|nr:YihY/virulence factor BrkB family protein [Ichthyobacteriaceae bacterium]
MNIFNIITKQRWYRKTVIVLKKTKIIGLEGLSMFDFIELYSKGLIEGALPTRAGYISYSFFMALFPFILFILTLIPYVPIEGFQNDLFKTLEHIMPPDTFNAVDSTIADIVTIKHGGLLSIGFFMAALLATNGINAIISGLTFSYHKIELRTTFNQYFTSLWLTFVLTMLFITSVMIIITSEVAMYQFTKNELIKSWIPTIVLGGRYITLMLLLFISVAMIFYYGPKSNQKWRFMSPGAFLSTVLIIITSYLFGIYVSDFAQYNKLYGSIGTLLVIMVWIYINAQLLLVGFDLNASIINIKKYGNKKLNRNPCK